MTEFETKDSGERKEFGNGGVRDTAEGKPRPDLLFPRGIPYEEQFLTRMAALMERGARKYDTRNWELFDSEEALEHAEGSLGRHYFQWQAGETDEDHLAAIAINCLFIATMEYKLGQIAMADLENVPQETPGLNPAVRDTFAQAVKIAYNTARYPAPIELLQVAGYKEPEDEEEKAVLFQTQFSNFYSPSAKFKRNEDGSFTVEADNWEHSVREE
jgi:hypothetical protein